MGIQNKVALIGIEGLSLELLLNVVESAKFTHIKTFFNNAAKFKLTSQVHHSGAASWTTIVTGMNPGKHGIFGDSKRVPGTYEFVTPNARFRQALPLWQIISEYGHKMGIFNVPVSYPPEPINGFFVSGSDMPGTASPFTYPNGLYLLIEETFGSYKADVDYTIVDYTAHLEDILYLSTHQFGVFELLLNKFSDVDVIFAVFTGLDRLLKTFDWKILSKLAQAEKEELDAWQILDAFFNQLDKTLKKILEINENFTIILVSPYGQQPNQAVININQWLLEAGLITLSDSRENLSSGIDWERTYAYSPGCDAQIYLNRRGREPKGIVEAGREAKEVREHICATLSDKVKQAREPLISNITPAEDIFSGPYIDSAPDLILELAPGCGVYNNLLTTEQSLRSNPADISPNIPADFGQSNCGVFVSYNHQVKIHEAKEHMQLEDITPTILSLMGIPIPQSMDGEPAYTLFEERRSVPPNKSTWEDKPTNLEALQERVSKLEEALQLKQVELAVQQGNLSARQKEIEDLKKLVVNLEKEIEGFRSGRIMRLLLWGGNFFKSLRGKLRS